MKRESRKVNMRDTQRAEGKQDDGLADWVQVKPMRAEQTTTKDNKRTQNSQKQSYNRKFIRINQHVAEMCTRINTKRHDNCSQ